MMNRFYVFFAMAFSCWSYAADLQYLGNDGGGNLTIENTSYVNGVSASFSSENPIINGKNVYAPDLVKNGGVWNIYYGGNKNQSDVNDRIYFAVSDDLLPEGIWYGQSVIIDKGQYYHVNDPSVQRRSSNQWVMAYTVANLLNQPNNELRDWIAISVSYDGAAWNPSAPTINDEITMDGSLLSVTFTDIARPSLLWTGTRWLLWFDGRTNNDLSPPSSYLAFSVEATPKNFKVIKKYPDLTFPGGVFPGFMEPDVEKIGNTYVAVVQERFNKLKKYTSTDGENFNYVGDILTASHPLFGRAVVDNPGWIYDGNSILGVAFGMSSGGNLINHDIGFAYTQYRVTAVSCPNTEHVYTLARYFSHSIQQLNGYNQICRIEIRHPVTGSLLVSKTVNSVAGDRWRFIP